MAKLIWASCAALVFVLAGCGKTSGGMGPHTGRGGGAKKFPDPAPNSTTIIGEKTLTPRTSTSTSGGEKTSTPRASTRTSGGEKTLTPRTSTSTSGGEKTSTPRASTRTSGSTARTRTSKSGGEKTSTPSNRTSTDTPSSNQGFECSHIVKNHKQCMYTITEITDESEARAYILRTWPEVEGDETFPEKDATTVTCGENAGEYKKDECEKTMKLVQEIWDLFLTVKLQESDIKTIIDNLVKKVYEVHAALPEAEINGANTALTSVNTYMTTLAGRGTLPKFEAVNMPWPGDLKPFPMNKFANCKLYAEIIDLYNKMGTAFPNIPYKGAVANGNDDILTVAAKDAKLKCKVEGSVFLKYINVEVDKSAAIADQSGFNAWAGEDAVDVEAMLTELRNTTTTPNQFPPNRQTPIYPAIVLGYNVNVKILNAPAYGTGGKNEFYYFLEIKGKINKNYHTEYDTQTNHILSLGDGGTGKFETKGVGVPEDFIPEKIDMLLMKKAGGPDQPDDVVGNKFVGVDFKGNQQKLEITGIDGHVPPNGEKSYVEIEFFQSPSRKDPTAGFEVKIKAVDKSYYLFTVGSTTSKNLWYASPVYKATSQEIVVYINVALPKYVTNTTAISVKIMEIFERSVPIKKKDDVIMKVESYEPQSIVAELDITESDPNPSKDGSSVKKGALYTTGGVGGELKAALENRDEKFKQAFKFFADVGAETTTRGTYYLFPLVAVFLVMLFRFFWVPKVVPVDEQQIDLASRLHANP